MKLLGSMIVVGMAVVTSGCVEEPTSKTAALQGRYSLELASGSMLPLTTYEASWSQAKLEVIGAELVPVSRSRMLDIVEYQATSEAGVLQTPYKDTIDVTYSLDGSTVTISRPRGSAAPTVETWTLDEDVMTGMKAFKNSLGVLGGARAVLYTVVN